MWCRIYPEVWLRPWRGHGPLVLGAGQSLQLSDRKGQYILFVFISLDWSITDVMYILYGHQWYQCNCRAPLIWKRFHLLLKVERDGPGYGWKIGHSRPEIFSVIKQNSVDLQRFFWLNCNANFTCVSVWFNMVDAFLAFARFACWIKEIEFNSRCSAEGSYDWLQDVKMGSWIWWILKGTSCEDAYNWW